MPEPPDDQSARKSFKGAYAYENRHLEISKKPFPSKGQLSGMVAELRGWKIRHYDSDGRRMGLPPNHNGGLDFHPIPDYGGSVNAVIGLYEWLSSENPKTRQRIDEWATQIFCRDFDVSESVNLLRLSPVQWCEAILRAHGKLTEWPCGLVSQRRKS